MTHADACDPIIAAAPPDFKMSCGSSWEVDLRSDVDCDQPGLERCHPRYTLGWRHREVQLYRAGLALPRVSASQWPEYIHAYCDVWHRGRLEQILAKPSEREDIRTRAIKYGEDLLGGRQNTAINHLHVVLLVVRNRGRQMTRAQLPRTFEVIERMRRHGSFRGGAFRQHVPWSTSAEASLRSLFYGTTVSAPGTEPNECVVCFRHHD